MNPVLHRPQPATMSIDEAAALLGVSRATIYKAANAGSIPSLRIGKRLLISREYINRFLEEGAKAPVAVAASN